MIIRLVQPFYLISRIYTGSYVINIELNQKKYDRSLIAGKHAKIAFKAYANDEPFDGKHVTAKLEGMLDNACVGRRFQVG